MGLSTRRLEELITEARSLAYQETYSYTEGWNDNVLVNIFNLGLDRLYAYITQIDNPAHIEEVRLNSVSGQQAYDLPIDVNMAFRIADVRYLYGTEDWQFIELSNDSIQDRWSYPGNLPQTWTIRDGQILLSPTPAESNTGNIIINFQKRMRRLDIRRGKVADVNDAASPVTIELDFTATSQKDANLRQNAESVLNLVNGICIVDFFGNPVINEIPIMSYNVSTQIITCEDSYTVPADELADFNAKLAAGTEMYPTVGLYSSTHSELDYQCESALIEFAVLRLLSLQSNAAGTEDQYAREQDVISYLVNQYRRSRPTVYQANMIKGRRSNRYPYINGRY